MRKIATLRFAYGSSVISPAGAGGLISFAARRRWYSWSSSRSLPCVVHHERHREDADDAGRDRDQHHVDDVVAVDLDERQHRRHRGGDRARGDPERRGDGGARQRPLRPDLVRVRELVDHGDQGEEGVARPGQDRQQPGDVRCGEVERFRPRAQRLARDQDHVVDPAGRLHRRRGSDHGDDDQHRADRRLAGREPEAEDEHERADAAPEAEADPARAHAERDEADHDEALEGDQDPVAGAHCVCSALSCWHSLVSRTVRASFGVGLGEVREHDRSARQARRRARAPPARTARATPRASRPRRRATLPPPRARSGRSRPSWTRLRRPPHPAPCRGRRRCRSPRPASRPPARRVRHPCAGTRCGPAASRTAAPRRRPCSRSSVSGCPRRSSRSRRARRRSCRRRSAPTRRREPSRRSGRGRRSARRRRARRRCRRRRESRRGVRARRYLTFPGRTSRRGRQRAASRSARRWGCSRARRASAGTRSAARTRACRDREPSSRSRPSRGRREPR